MYKSAPLTSVLIAVGILTATVQAASSQAEDEKAIRLVVDSFTKAYNAGDAKALASLFLTDGEIVSESGESFQGQAAIERTFAAIFKKNPKSKIEIKIKSIRFLGPTTAIEDGSTTITHASGIEERNRYTVVHVKQDGRWRMASARDLPDENAAENELKELEWLIGSWVDESHSAMTVTTYRWGENRRSILCDFQIQVGGRPIMTGTHEIRWDPAVQKLHSWIFDSEGGFVEGLWTRNGKQWILKMTGTTRDGKPASATNVITQTAKDRMTWQSRDRVIGDEMRPDIKDISIVRKPPQPQEQKSSKTEASVSKATTNNSKAAKAAVPNKKTVTPKEKKK